MFLFVKFINLAIAPLLVFKVICMPNRISCSRFPLCPHLSEPLIPFVITLDLIFDFIYRFSLDIWKCHHLMTLAPQNKVAATAPMVAAAMVALTVMPSLDSVPLVTSVLPGVGGVGPGFTFEASHM